MLHVLIGDQQDLEAIGYAIERDGVISWVVPRSAVPGDAVLIFFRNMNAIFGAGEVLATPMPSMFGNRHVHRAEIGIGPAIDPPLSLDEFVAFCPIGLGSVIQEPTQRLLMKSQKSYGKFLLIASRKKAMVVMNYLNRRHILKVA